jgi:hypothetical protein
MERIRKKTIQIYRYIQMFSKNSHAYRAYAHTVRVKSLRIIASLSICMGVGWGEDVSQNIHAYRVRAVRVIVFNTDPPPSLTHVSNTLEEPWNK